MRLRLTFSREEVEALSDPRPGSGQPVRAQVTISYRDPQLHERAAQYLLESSADEIEVRVEK
jgi:hypothetical protein